MLTTLKYGLSINSTRTITIKKTGVASKSDPRRILTWGSTEKTDPGSVFYEKLGPFSTVENHSRLVDLRPPHVES